MSRNIVLLLAVCLMAFAGCRNPCYNTCGNGYAAHTIAAPPTYSLNIPSVANNQPYYVPGNTIAPNRTANSNNAFNASNAANVQGGWGPQSSSNSSGNSGSTGQSVLTSPTTFVEVSPTAPVSPFPTASPSALPGSGQAFTDSTNYRTTSIDETQDQTRVAATDASTVRAPASAFPTGNLRVAQLPRPTTFVYPNTHNATASAAQPVYSGTPIVSGAPGYYGQPAPRYIGTPIIASGPTVVAQSTTQFDAARGSSQGWRDREIGSSETF